MIKSPYVYTTAAYVLRDQPNEKQPLRRLQTEGGEVVEINDLLRIALGEDVLPDNILSGYGGQFLGSLHTVSDIMETLSLNAAQATRLLAILSLGKRLYGLPTGSLVQIRGIEDVFQNYQTLSHLPKEQLKVLLLNSRYQVVHEETLAIGSVDYLHIEPRDVFQSAVERRVNGIILVHNHPSGDATPSQSDYDFSIRIRDAGALLGIELLDHVIIGSRDYCSAIPPTQPEEVGLQKC